MTSIGRYRLEARIASGGMADVHLARLDGPGGFSKKYVIKTMREELTADPHFVEMFLTEARLAAMLAHPNVVHVIDFGRDGDRFFIAMEYVDGATLKTIAQLAQQTRRPLPPMVVAHALAGAAAGAAYIHELRDKDGVLLGVVHRDISPDNIIVGIDGTAKLLDFGVAKAVNFGPQTTAGTLKGKLSYMSPEQVRGMRLDGRSDVYSLGVTLYELLAGRRPIVAENELELALSVLERDPPPLAELAPHVPKALVEIVERAMHRDRERRFQTARELQDELEAIVAPHRTRARTELRDLVRHAATKRPLRLSRLDATTEPAVPAPIAARTAGSDGAADATTVDRGPAEPTGTLEAESPRQRQKRRRTMAMGGAAALVVIVAATAYALIAGSDVPEPRSAPVPSASESRGTHPSGNSTEDESPRSTPALASPSSEPVTPPAASRPTPATATPAVPLPSASGTSSATTEPAASASPPAGSGPTATPTRSPPRSASAASPDSADRNGPDESRRPESRTGRQARATTGEGTLSLRSNPWCHVKLDGEPIGQTPLFDYKLRAGKHRLLLTNAKLGARRELTVTIAPGQAVERAVVFKLGLVKVEAAAGTRIFRGSELLATAPSPPLELVAGEHTLGFVAPGTRTLTTRKVTVRADQTVTVTAP